MKRKVIASRFRTAVAIGMLALAASCTPADGQPAVPPPISAPDGDAVVDGSALPGIPRPVVPTVTPVPSPTPVPRPTPTVVVACMPVETLEDGFIVGSADVPAAVLRSLERLVASLPPGPVTVVGHTDDTPVAIGNQRLSELRAEAVALVLVDLGVSGDRIETSGRADEVPVASNETAAGRARNRRIEIFVGC